MNTDIKASYTAANSIPVKILLDEELIKAFRNGRILPRHIQFIPTNRCNMNCPFCSCSERNKKLELDFKLACRIIDLCHKLGTKAVTITGGGEPLLYPQFNELLAYFISKNIKVGLVSNGLLLHTSRLDGITWCRISNGDYRTFSTEYEKNLKETVGKYPGIDWAFSHVVSEFPNLDEIGRIVQFGNENSFTHIRLVSDLFKPENVPMDPIRKYLREKGINDTRVIYQGRKEYTKGGDCYICFLKPLIGPDAKVYTCCGVQYALKEPSMDLPPELCLGDALEMDKIISGSNKPFDGKICVKCYYENYNIILKSLLSNIEHQDFL